jgi:hypothetical protein
MKEQRTSYEGTLEWQARSSGEVMKDEVMSEPGFGEI